MAAYALSGIVERVYDPSIVFRQVEQEETEVFSLPPRKPKKRNEQRSFVYTEEPEELSQERILGKVGNQDGRIRVVKTTAWPHTIHAQLSMLFGKKIYGGSGVIVGPHHLLTCAHNIYDNKKNEWAKKITVHPALNDDHAPFGETKVAKVYTYSNWIDKGDKRFDIALLILSESIGKVTGWGGVACLSDQEITQERVTVTGYPGDKGRKQMWEMTHQVSSIASEEFEYEIDTYAGQSGSAIWINKWGQPYILGVHTLGGDAKNYGVRISAQKFSDFFIAAISMTRKLIFPASSLSVALPSVPLTREGRGRALIKAAAIGDRKRVEQLLALDTDINAKNADGETPLMCACENGFDQIVALLIENGADVNIERTDGDRALEIATRKNHTPIVYQLCEEGAKLTKEVVTGSPPASCQSCPAIIAAAGLGNVELVRLFLDKGVRLDEFEWRNTNSPWIGTSSTTIGGRALIEACSKGRTEVVALFLERNIRLGDTISSSSCSRSRPTTTLGDSALSAAVSSQNWDIAVQLLKAGAGDLLNRGYDEKISAGMYMLWNACTAGAIETVQELLNRNIPLAYLVEKKEAPPSQPTYDERTRKYWIQRRDLYITVGSRALEYAREHPAVLQLLRSRGAKEAEIY